MKKIFFAIIFMLCGQLLFAQNKQPPQIDGNTRKAVLQSICNAINSYYVFPDRAKSMSDYIKKQGEAGKYDSLNNPSDFANEVVKDIRSVFNDKHLRIEYDPELEKDIIKFISSKRGADQVSEADIAQDRKKNFYFKKIEILPSNIGYIEFTNFASPSLPARKTVNAAMQFVSNTDALILDLRNNFGGNAAMANEILGYFFNARTYTGKSFNRIENKWVDNYVENKKAVTQGLVLNMPVYILTSNRTFSAAEGLAYTLQSMKNVVIIGDTTRGGAHLTRSFSLGNGFVGFIPYLRGENVKTKTDWEGTGVIPDIKIEESKSLLTAQNTILTRKLAAAANDTEKRKISWLINYYKSTNSDVVADSSNAAKFIGRFAEFEITVKENQLMFRDTNQPNNNPKKLTAITSTLFQVGNDYQVEFIIEENGSCNSIKMYWEDGWVETVKRTK